ncbi:MAG TPA: toxin-antitoxin system YwqK family antitoxin [Bacteroidia bacterium]|nr:toxin-antitoxin system YwqK family antitoxin [Bacteroidia bacterium]
MRNWLTGSVLVIITIFCFSAGTPPYDEEQSLIGQLADTSQTVRDTAAARMRRLIAEGRTTNGVGHLQEHDRSYWEAMISKVNMRVELSKVKQELKLNDDDGEFGFCNGQTCQDNCRLDNSYAIVLTYMSNPPYTVLHDSLLFVPRRIHVPHPGSGNPKGKFTGTWINYFVNGQQAYSNNFVDGLFHGPCTVFHHNGQVAYRQHYVKGVAHGEDRGFYLSGALMYVGTYSDGKQNGEWIHYYEDGTVKLKSNYVNGIHEGTEQSFYENGKLYWESSYEKGDQVRHRSWDKEGNLMFDTWNQK